MCARHFVLTGGLVNNFSQVAIGWHSEPCATQIGKLPVESMYCGVAPVETARGIYSHVNSSNGGHHGQPREVAGVARRTPSSHSP